MNDLLKEIIANKRKEVEANRNSKPLAELVKSPLFEREAVSFEKSILSGNGIIAEFKRKSPSAGKLSEGHKLESTVLSYQENKVSGYSILTDHKYFGGSIADLKEAKGLVHGPILRKDFIIDEYQIFEAKANGADAILLIAEALDEYHARYLSTIAHSIGLEVLMEFHSAEELHKLNENVDVVGVNNRNLKTLKTDIRTSFELIRQLPFGLTKIAESGISSPYEIQELLSVGYNGFLIGESVLRHEGLLKRLVESVEKTKSLRYEN